MAEADFYQILGVKRSATADEIRSAFRELVKKYHPDLFATAAEKQQATERLRLVNEAYAVLGNPQRRREYDQKTAHEPTPPRSPPPRRNRSTARRGAKTAASPRRRKIHIDWSYLSKKPVRYALAAAAAVLLLIYATRPQPRWTVGWILVENVEISSLADASPSPRSAQNWSPVAQFDSAPECAAALKKQVREDEREGSKAVFDERNGMMAITVQVRKAAAAAGSAKAGGSSESAVVNDAGSTPEQVQEAERAFSNGAVRRVRNIECRAARRLETSSWAQRAWRQLGGSS